MEWFCGVFFMMTCAMRLCRKVYDMNVLLEEMQCNGVSQQWILKCCIAVPLLSELINPNITSFLSTNTPLFMTNNTISTELSMKRGRDLRVVKTLHLLQRVSFKTYRLEKRQIYSPAPLPRLRRATTVLTAVSE